MRKRVEAIDGLRGIGCIWIAFLTHYVLNETSSQREIFSIWGNYCVELFFMISGFGMAYAYRNRFENISLLSFIGKRYKKIMPLYWVTLTVATVLYIVFYKMGITYSDVNSVFFYDVFSLVLAFSGTSCGWVLGINPTNAPSWYINVLFLCYIIYYFIGRVFKKNTNVYVGLLAVWFFLGFCGLYFNWQVPFLYEPSCRGYMSFALGALLYEVYERITEQAGKKMSVFGGICVVIMMVSYFVFGTNEMWNNARFLPALFICPVIIFSTIYVEPIKMLLSCKLLMFLAKISMSVYLWHWSVKLFLICVGNFVPNVRFGTIGGYVMYIAMTCIISVISHYYLEPLLIRYFGNVIEKSLKRGIRV